MVHNPISTLSWNAFTQVYLRVRQKYQPMRQRRSRQRRSRHWRSRHWRSRQWRSRHWRSLGGEALKEKPWRRSRRGEAVEIPYISLLAKQMTLRHSTVIAIYHDCHPKLGCRHYEPIPIALVHHPAATLDIQDVEHACKNMLLSGTSSNKQLSIEMKIK